MTANTTGDPAGERLAAALEKVNPPEARRLISRAIEVAYPPPATVLSFPGLPGVVAAIGGMDGESPDTVSKAASAAKTMPVRWREPPTSKRQPIAWFLWRTSGGEGKAPVSAERLQATGPAALELVRAALEADSGRAPRVIPLINELLADPLLSVDPVGLLTVFERHYGTTGATTHNQRAADLEWLSALLDTPVLVDRVSVERRPRRAGDVAPDRPPGPRSAPTSGPSLRRQREVQVDNLLKARRAPIRSGGIGGQPGARSASDPRNTWLISRECGTQAPGGPTLQHAAWLLSRCDVRAPGDGTVHGDAAALAEFAIIVAAVVHMTTLPRAADDEAVLRAPLDAKIAKALGFDSQAGMAAADDSSHPFAPHPLIACEGVQPLTQLEAALWHASSVADAQPDQLRLSREPFVGEVTTVAALRGLGRRLMLESGLEPSDVCLLGGPAERGDDSQVAYEVVSANELATCAAQARRVAYRRLTANLPAAELEELKARGHLLVALAEEAGPTLCRLPDELGCGSRYGLRIEVPRRIAAMLRERPPHLTGVAEHDYLSLALAVDLLINYGVRSEALPRFLRADLSRSAATLYVPGKRGPAGMVDGTLPAAAETIAMADRILVLRTALRLRAPELLWLAAPARPVSDSDLVRLAMSLGLTHFRPRSLRQEFNSRLRAARVPEWTRRALLLHYDPVRLPYQPGTDVPASMNDLLGALTAVRIPLGILRV